MGNRVLEKISIDADRVRKRLGSKKWSIRHFAKELGISDRTLRTWLKNGEIPKHYFAIFFWKLENNIFDGTITMPSFNPQKDHWVKPINLESPDAVTVLNAYMANDDQVLQAMHNQIVYGSMSGPDEAKEDKHDDAVDTLRFAADHLKMEKPQDNVNHPSHYTFGEIEVITYIRDKLSPEEFQGYCMGNCLKYISRHRHKNGVEDLKKAQVYLGWMIESEEAEK